MATDEREEEREFLGGLKARTGRDLGEWMAAIAAHGCADKNEIIDWLREQGLPFARASWLERIYRNGCRPIYSDPAPRKTQERPAREPVLRAPPAGSSAEPAAKPSIAVSAAAPAETAGGEGTAALDKLVAAAKGYRPLYHLLEAEMRNMLPNLSIVPSVSFLSLRAPREFGALTLHATELRLGLDLGDRPFDPLLQKARLKGPAAAITHMAVLTDARQVNEELFTAIKAANFRVNG